MARRNLWERAALLLLALCVFLISVAPALGVSGSTVTYNVTENGMTRTPANHTANRSTITTIVLSSIQQDARWKAYVGNVTGVLTLDDTDGNTVYNWSALSAPTGEIYVSRYSNISFSSVVCVENTTVATEQVFHNMSGNETDSINLTFSSLAHQAFWVGSQQIVANSCRSIATFVSDGYIAPSSSAVFQEILMEDQYDQFFYVANVNNDKTGFDSSSYDFQLIVAESDIKSSPTTYYFYLELS